MVVLHQPDDPIDFSRGQTSELNGNVMETTIPASFKSLRAALIPAILPIQVVLSVAGGGNVKIFTCFSYNVSVRVQSGDGYHACYFNREKLMERIV